MKTKLKIWNDKSQQTEEIDVTPVVLKLPSWIEKYDFLVHPTVGGKGFTLSEKTSACAVVIGCETEKEAIEKGLANFLHHGEKQVSETIRKRIATANQKQKEK